MTKLAAPAAWCLKRIQKLAPSAAWVHLPAAPRSSCRPALSPVPPPPPPVPPRLPPPPPPPCLLSPGPAAWTCPAPCPCRTLGSSRPCSGLAVSVAERPHQSVTLREVSARRPCGKLPCCLVKGLSVHVYSNQMFDPFLEFFLCFI